MFEKIVENVVGVGRLIIEWGGSDGVREGTCQKALNYFTYYFDKPSSIEGVKKALQSWYPWQTMTDIGASLQSWLETSFTNFNLVDGVYYGGVGNLTDIAHILLGRYEQVISLDMFPSMTDQIMEGTSKIMPGSIDVLVGFCNSADPVGYINQVASSNIDLIYGMQALVRMLIYDCSNAYMALHDIAGVIIGG